MAPTRYEFRPLAVEDLPLVGRWLKQPHVAQWWPDDTQLQRIRAHIDDPAIDALLVHADDRPIGYLQCYDPHSESDHPFRDQPAGTRGIDQFIGETGMIDRGHGSALTRRFVERLFAAGAPRVVTDPDPANARAVRSYAKAGFCSDRVVDTPWGRTLLMVCAAS
jgi:aminoglycoside 6'-N-acetyltransferase